MIIIDENVDQWLIDRIDKGIYKIISVKDQYQGISDKKVIQLAKLNKGMVITEDKDFGELVFSNDIKDCTVIFLRYNKNDLDQIAKSILRVLEEYYFKPEHFFITIMRNKIRVRKI